MRRSWAHSIVCAWTTWAVLLGGCRTALQPVTRPVAAITSAAPANAVAPSGRPAIAFATDSDDGELTLRVGASTGATVPASVTDLAAADTTALLARLEPLPAVDNTAAPVIRPPSAPPPRAGAATPIAFVAATGKVIADRPVSDAPLGPVALAAPQILPTGEVTAESMIRVRFTEPMVAVAAVGPAKTPPATIAPAVPGEWRWVDTRVAVFTAAGKRLPMATELTVTVPAGTRALSGATLVSDVVGTFATPPVTIVGMYPTTVLRPDSAMLIKLDQTVDTDAIAKLLRVEDSKGRAQPFSVTTLAAAQASWQKNPAIAHDKSELGTSYVVIAPTRAWRSGSGRVVLGAGAPSREGARLTTRPTATGFSIAAPFVARGIECESRGPRVTGARCPGFSYATVRFSNPIDATTYRSKLVQIAGQPFDDHTANHNSVNVETPPQVGGTYKVALGAGLTDAYGQPLVGPRELSFSTTRYVFDPTVNARSGLYVLDPRFEIPQWVIHAQAIASLRVQLYQVQPADYFAYVGLEHSDRKTPPGTRVHVKDYVVGSDHGAELRVDLRPALTDGTGHVVAIATATPARGHKLSKHELRHVAWIQVSRLGVTARVDGERAHVWTHDITPAAFLQPIPGVETSMLVQGRSDAPPPVVGDASGHAAYELLPRASHDSTADPTALVIARHGADSAFVALSNRYEKSQRDRDARWYVTDDRFTYKPGEPVYIKGWLRWVDGGIDPALALPASGEQLAYQLSDSRGNKLASGTTSFTKHGGFDLTVQLPPNVNLGTAMLVLSTSQHTHRHALAIEEFRTPAYAVTLTDDVQFSGSRPLVLGESIAMSTEAKYYGGGGLPGSTIEWDVALRSATYKPPGWDRYTFDPMRPRSERRSWRRTSRGTSAREASTLSGGSTAALEIEIAALPTRAPSLLTVDATVTDLDRQRIRASSRAILVHPATLYVGLRLRPGETDELQAIVSDLDGNAIAGVPIDITIEGVLASERGRDTAEVVDTQRCEVSSAATPVPCAFTRKDHEIAYTAVARIKDDRGRENVALLDVPWWSPDDRDLKVVSDKQVYRPGDVAKVTVSSTTQPASAVVTFARGGVIEQQHIDLTAPATLELPIKMSYIENIKVVVDRVTKRRYQTTSSSDPRSRLPLPDHDSVELDLGVDLESARLSMRTRPLQALVEPGDTASFEVEVRHDDRPVQGAEVALIVVDEAVLAVSGRSHADPLAPFYARVDDGTWAFDNLNLIDDAGSDLAGNPGFERWKLDAGRYGFGTGSGYGSGSGYGGMSGRGAAGAQRGPGFVKSRKDFRATAVFSPKLETDASGKVRVTVTMPDSLTRFRIVALATARTGMFGKAENNIVTQRKVNARTVAPRFLTQGDAFALPVIVQNLDSVPRTIDVAVRAANLGTTGAQGKRVIVPPGQRAEVRFGFATQTRGKAVIQTIAVAGDTADASNIALPVYEPATTESFATYGTVEDEARFEQLVVPANVFPEVGGVEAELSSTQLHGITDAFWYLQAYPYECAEQRSARMLAAASLHDVLDAFQSPRVPSKQQITAQQAYDVAKLTRDQRNDGGWGFFRDMASDPFVSAQVLAALAAQGTKGQVVTRATAFVGERVAVLQRELAKTVKSRDARMVRRPDDLAAIGMVAHMLSSLAAAGNDVSARAVKLHAAGLALGAYPVDAKARVLAILAGKAAHKAIRAKLVAELLSVIHETAGAATVTTDYGDAERMLLVSSHKTTALVLDALLREAPQHDLVSKLARGLLGNRVRGRWRSTQENLVVLQAMRRYFDVYEKDRPDFTGRLWLGTGAYAEKTFVGRTTERATTFADWSQLPPGSAHEIAIDRAGTGRMYYRLGITYAPRSTNLPPLDAGFIVRRSYQAVDDPSDVVQQPDGSWRIKLGARVLVQLEALNTTARHAVALVDPLPAGLESVNTRLVTSERAVSDPLADRWDHVAMRDNRSEAFRMELPEGSHHFSYTARATTPGTFIAAPAKAEEMYSPETFGRSTGTTVVIQ